METINLTNSLLFNFPHPLSKKGRDLPAADCANRTRSQYQNDWHHNPKVVEKRASARETCWDENHEHNNKAEGQAKYPANERAEQPEKYHLDYLAFSF